MSIRWKDTSRNYPKVGHLENHPAPRTVEEARAVVERERARRDPSRNRPLMPA